MRLLSYSYHMHLKFERPVTNHHFKLRCFPLTDERQHITNEQITIQPVHFRNSVTDSFGNACIYGTAKQEHELFSVDVSGNAEIDSCAVTADPNQLAVFRAYSRARRRQTDSGGQSEREDIDVMGGGLYNLTCNMNNYSRRRSNNEARGSMCERQSRKAHR